MGKCFATIRAASGNELARAERLEAEGMPILAAVARAGQTYTCTLQAGHEGSHREVWSGLMGVEWSDEPDAPPPAHVARMGRRRRQ